MKNIAKKEYFPSLNGLRAISILMVLLCHINLQDHIFSFVDSDKSNKYYFLKPLLDVFANGALGVNVFFVISGFLITSLLLKEEGKTGTISLKKFYTRRTLRIFPAYYFLLLFYFVMQCVGVIHLSHISWITAVTYTSCFNVTANEWPTLHVWSLSVEEFFYLCWPLIFLVFKKQRTFVLLGLIVAAIVFKVYAQHYKPTVGFFPVALVVRGDAISMGCLFAIHKDRILAFLTSRWYVGVLAFFVLFGWIYSYEFIVIQHQVKLGMVYVPLGVADGIVADTAIAVIMFYAIYGPKNLFHKFLNNKIVNWIGLLSYSLYLWQQFFTIDKPNFYFRFPLNVLLIFAVASFSHYCIERPFLKLKKRFEV